MVHTSEFHILHMVAGYMHIHSYIYATSHFTRSSAGKGMNGHPYATHPVMSDFRTKLSFFNHFKSSLLRQQKWKQISMKTILHNVTGLLPSRIPQQVLVRYCWLVRGAVYSLLFQCSAQSIETWLAPRIVSFDYIMGRWDDDWVRREYSSPDFWYKSPQKPRSFTPNICEWSCFNAIPNLWPQSQSGRRPQIDYNKISN